MVSIFQVAASDLFCKNTDQAPKPIRKDTEIKWSILKAYVLHPQLSPAPWREVPQEGMNNATGTCSPCT